MGISNYVSLADVEAQEMCLAIEERKEDVPFEERLKYYQEISWHCEAQIRKITEEYPR